MSEVEAGSVLLQGLNPEQAAAVCHLEGPMLVLAGAGSGKTRVLTHRIAYLLQRWNMDPENVLAVTFTNKAANEMKHRIAELVGSPAKKLWVGTFHSTCARILRAEAEVLGYTRSFAIYDDDDQLRAIKQIIGELGYDPKQVVASDILGRIDHYKNRRVGVEDLVEEVRAHAGQPLVKVWRAYEELLRSADAMDFNDLIGKIATLFTEHPDVLEKYRIRFRQVLVDEYQDTNRAQYAVLHMLAGEHRNLTVVGDDDQSIYGFRGAEIRNILDFGVDFAPVNTIRLERNYRSTSRILAVANAVVEKNAERIDKRMWTSQGEGQRVSFLVADDPHAEARMVAEGVRTLVRRGETYGRIAIIYRTNMASQPFEAALRELGIRHRVMGGRPFYARREVRDVLGFMRVVVNPADDAAVLRVINVPPRGIGQATLKRLREAAAERGDPLLKTARALSRSSADRGMAAVGAFVGLIDELSDLADQEDLAAFVDEVMLRSGYRKMLEEDEERESRDRLTALGQLARAASVFEYENEEIASPTPRDVLTGWLDRMALAGAEPEEDPEGGVVTLMTVHSSKGLEFPIVFVVQVVEGQFPHSRSEGEPGGVEEERRLAYVAFTRAQERLVITRARQSVGFDPRTGKPVRKSVAPSRFLYGIPEDACDGAVPTLGEGTVDEIGGHSTPGVRPGSWASNTPSPEVREEGPRLMPGARIPEGEYRTRAITSLEDVGPETRVLHPRYGVGRVEFVKAPKLAIRFEGRFEYVAAHDPSLQILLD